MSTCHQAHNIPWNTLLEMLEKIPSDQPYVTIRGKAVYNTFKLCFIPDEGGSVIKRLKFFASKFDASIKEFAKTERAKYSDKDLDQITELYGPESFTAESLTEGSFQNISGWIKPDGSVQTNSYGDTHLDSLKELLIQEKVASLLCLARKGFPIENYQFVTYSNFFHYGFGRIKEDCLTLYIHLNLLLASNTLREPDQWYLQWRRFREDELLNTYDGNRKHSHLFREYFEKNPNFENMDDLRNLLKKLFRTLYFYDMVLAERGKPISWVTEVARCIGSYFCETNKNTGDFWWKQLDALIEETNK